MFHSYTLWNYRKTENWHFRGIWEEHIGLKWVDRGLTPLTVKLTEY